MLYLFLIAFICCFIWGYNYKCKFEFERLVLQGLIKNIEEEYELIPKVKESSIVEQILAKSLPFYNPKPIHYSPTSKGQTRY